MLWEESGVPRCFCGMSALIYYGTGRIRDVIKQAFLISRFSASMSRIGR